jgi:hydrogenase expression/formation protein HypC
MCITAPARVLAVDGDVAAVELDGRRRLATLAVLPDVVAGDWVIVGAGTILRRLDPSDAQDLAERIDAARAVTALRASGSERSVPPAAKPTTGAVRLRPEGESP